MLSISDAKDKIDAWNMIHAYWRYRFSVCTLLFNCLSRFFYVRKKTCSYATTPVAVKRSMILGLTFIYIYLVFNAVSNIIYKERVCQYYWMWHYSSRYKITNVLKLVNGSVHVIKTDLILCSTWSQKETERTFVL